MEATSTGPNRTGASVNPAALSQMLEAAQQHPPQASVGPGLMDVERQRYIAEAESVGSIPTPRSALKSTAAKIKGVTGGRTLGVLLDKLGERIAFERAGTRLYDALITKCTALVADGGLPHSRDATGATDASVLVTLARIRNQELEHFQMLTRCVEQLGGDPTAQTPCADVTAAASIGLLQVVSDPRTTLAQSLNAVLTAELTDNAGWELLTELAELAGQDQFQSTFVEALAVEEEHLEIIRAWLRTLVTDATGTPAV